VRRLATFSWQTPAPTSVDAARSAKTEAKSSAKSAAKDAEQAEAAAPAKRRKSA